MSVKTPRTLRLAYLRPPDPCSCCLQRPVRPGPTTLTSRLSATGTPLFSPTTPPTPRSIFRRPSFPTQNLGATPMLTFRKRTERPILCICSYKGVPGERLSLYLYGSPDALTACPNELLNH